MQGRQHSAQCNCRYKIKARSPAEPRASVRQHEIARGIGREKGGRERDCGDWQTRIVSLGSQHDEHQGPAQPNCYEQPTPPGPRHRRMLARSCAPGLERRLKDANVESQSRGSPRTAGSSRARGLSMPFPSKPSNHVVCCPTAPGLVAFYASTLAQCLKYSGACSIPSHLPCVREQGRAQSRHPVPPAL